MPLTTQSMPSREEMFALLKMHIQPIVRTECLPLIQACGRVSAEDVRAKQPMPGMPSAGKDGIAFSFTLVEKGLPEPSLWVCGRDYDFCNTGCAIPIQYDTMLEIESVRFDEAGRLTLKRLPVKRGEGVIAAGSHISEKEVLLAAGERVTPALIGILASGGVTELNVIAKPRVIFIPTGDELVPFKTNPVPPGKNTESNSLMLLAYLAEWGCEAKALPIIPDDYKTIFAALKEALAEADIVLICAGSSKGTKDFTIKVLKQMGVMVAGELNHGPGKHCSFFLADGKPVIGLPGPPGGAELTARLYVQAAVQLLLCQPIRQPVRIEAVLAKPLGPMGMDFIVRLHLYRRNGIIIAKPLSLFSGTRRSAYVRGNAQYYLKKGCTFAAGERIWVELLTTMEYLEGGTDYVKQRHPRRIRAVSTETSRRRT